MAKQLYDYWFVQFDFPNEEGKPYKSSGGKMVWNEKLKREIPEGWDISLIKDIATTYSGGTPKSTNIEYYDNGEIAWINSGELNSPIITKTTNYITKCGLENSSAKLYPSNSILVAMYGATAGKVSLLTFEACSNQAVCGVIPTIENMLYYVYFHISSLYSHFITLSTGSARDNISQDTIKNILLPIPTRNILKLFDEKIGSIYQTIVNNYQQIDSLTKQRDELLPLLMNGQVSVNSDLAVSYIIYKDINIRIMKENIIQAIVAEMQRDLDCRQMARLKAVLTSELHNVEIIEKSDCATQQTQENEHLLNSFISAKKIEGCSDKTLTYYRNTIERLLVTLSLAICHITTTDIRTYLSDYQEEHQSSKVTIDNMRRIFSSFFAWLEDEDYIAKSPVRRIHKVKTDSLVKEVLSDEQLEQLRDSCTTKRDLAIIDFLSSTGIRVGELVKLSREDIDFHERQCVVFGKGNKERVVYFNARTKLHLQQYLNERTDSNPALFVSLNSPHSRLTISGVEVRIRKMGQALSMPKVHPHKFRRTLATMAIDKGMPIEQVQRLLGHVRIDTTLHYAIVNQNNVKLAHKKYLG